MPNPAPFPSTTYKRDTGCGKIYITIGEKPIGKIAYVSVDMGKAGGCASASTDVLGRLIGRSLKNGVELKKIISDLIGTRCHASIVVDGEEVLSCADCVGKVLKEYLAAKTEQEEKK